MDKVRFLEEYTHPGGVVSKKGKTRFVTSRLAAILSKDKIAEIIEDKEDKNASGRATK
jgi:hypothetical protein